MSLLSYQTHPDFLIGNDLKETDVQPFNSIQDHPIWPRDGHNELEDFFGNILPMQDNPSTAITHNHLETHKPQASTLPPTTTSTPPSKPTPIFPYDKQHWQTEISRLQHDYYSLQHRSIYRPRPPRPHYLEYPSSAIPAPLLFTDDKDFRTFYHHHLPPGYPFDVTSKPFLDPGEGRRRPGMPNPFWLDYKIQKRDLQSERAGVELMRLGQMKAPVARMVACVEGTDGQAAKDSPPLEPVQEANVSGLVGTTATEANMVGYTAIPTLGNQAKNAEEVKTAFLDYQGQRLLAMPEDWLPPKDFRVLSRRGLMDASARKRKAEDVAA